MASISRRMSSSSMSDPAGSLMVFNLYRTPAALLAPLQQDWTFILGAVTKAKASRYFPPSKRTGEGSRAGLNRGIRRLTLFPDEKA